MKKIFSLLMVMILMLAGCSSDESDTGAIGDGDDKLIMWSFFEGAPKEALDYYAEETGQEVEFVTIGWDDYQTKLNTVIGTSDAPDIVVLEKSFMGTFTPSDNFLAYENIISEQELLDTYKENTAIATQGPGIVDDQTKAIGWENTASAFFYRSDLAEECLGITSPEQMEEVTQTFEDYYTLYDELQNSDNETCSEMAMFAEGAAYQTGQRQELGMYGVEDDAYVIPSEYATLLEQFKSDFEIGLVYSPTEDNTQIINGTKDDGFLGNIEAAWLVQDIEKYEQPGLWAIADTPVDFSAGGSFMAVTNTSDVDLVDEFMSMTMLSEDWLLDNMESFGMVGNETLTKKYLETNDGSNDYFGGQNTVEKLAEINDGIDYYVPVSVYDSGIGNSIDSVTQGYTLDGTYKTTDETIEALQDEINSLYPELDVTIE